MHLHDTVGGDTVNQFSFTKYFFLQYSEVQIYNKDSSAVLLRINIKNWFVVRLKKCSHKPRENFS